ATVGGMSATARVRVAPTTTYFNDFEKIPVGVAPAGWISSQGKWSVQMLDGNKVLAKVNTLASPLIARGNTYITLPTAKDYTIEAEARGDKAKDFPDLPEFGIVANGYSLTLFGGVQKLRLLSWDPVPRIDSTVQFEFKPGQWYSFKLATPDDKGVVRGKA